MSYKFLIEAIYCKHANLLLHANQALLRKFVAVGNVSDLQAKVTNFTLLEMSCII